MLIKYIHPRRDTCYELVKLEIPELTKSIHKTVCDNYKYVDSDDVFKVRVDANSIDQRLNRISDLNRLLLSWTSSSTY